MQNLLTSDDIVIIGGGGFAREVAEYADIAHVHSCLNGKREIHYIDASNENEFLEKITDPQTICPNMFFNGMGSEKRRGVLENFEKIISKEKWKIIDLSNFNGSKSGIGSIFAPSCVVSVNTKIGKFCLINYCASVGHDCVLGNYVTVSPNASIGGWCILEDECYIGAGANILPKKTIGKGAVIGAGAVVTKDVPAGAVAKGVPATW